MIPIPRELKDPGVLLRKDRHLFDNYNNNNRLNLEPNRLPEGNVKTSELGLSFTLSYVCSELDFTRKCTTFI